MVVAGMVVDCRSQAAGWYRRALAAAVMLVLSHAALAATPAGSVVGVNGQCFAQSGAQRSALKLGDAVNVGDTIDVSAGGKLKLRMSDGSVISVAPESRFTVAAYQVDAAGQRRDGNLSLAQGLLRAVVAPTSGPPNFEIATAVGAAAARSTDWFVEARPGAAQVGVVAGSVSLSSTATNRSVTIPAGWGARLEAGRDPVPARVWSPAEFGAFIDRTNLQ